MTYNNTAIALPTFHTAQDRFEYEVIQMFHHCYQEFLQEGEVTKILSSIEKVAYVTGHGDAYISKILVGHGLRAPRIAFPQDYVEHVDQVIGNMNFNITTGLSSGCEGIIEFWETIGDFMCDAALDEKSSVSLPRL
jgi:hypothetical protein